MLNYTLKKGETFSQTITLEDENGKQMKLATAIGSDISPLAYFHGTAIKGTDRVNISFKYAQQEVIDGEVGIFELKSFIPCDTHPSDDDPINSTLLMGAGDWQWVIRYSATQNPINDDETYVILEGVLTIEDAIDYQGSDPANFSYPNITQ